MFRVKNVRGSTVAKNSGISPGYTEFKPIAAVKKPTTPIRAPAPPTTKQTQPQNKLTSAIPIKITHRTILAPNKPTKQQPKPAINLNNSKRPASRLKGTKNSIVQIKKGDMVETKVSQNESKVLEGKSQVLSVSVVNVEEKVDGSQISKEQEEKLWRFKEEQMAKLAKQKEDQLEKEKKNLLELEREKERQQQRQREQQKQRRRKQKKAEQQLERQRQEQAQAQIAKIMQRRKQRELQRSRQKQLQQKQQTQLKLFAQKLKNSQAQNQSHLGGMMYTNDPLAHFEFSEALMDLQINKIIKSSFSHFPSGQAIQAKKAELQRINNSYLMVRADSGNGRLRDGLGNYRMQLFNQIGQMIVDDQRKGFQSTNFRIIQADRHTKLTQEVHLTRGIPKQKIPTSFTTTVNSPDNAECSICLEQIQTSQKCHIFPCKHIFHIKCSEDWIEATGNCPICRKNLKF